MIRGGLDHKVIESTGAMKTRLNLTLLAPLSPRFGPTIPHAVTWAFAESPKKQHDAPYLADVAEFGGAPHAILESVDGEGQPELVGRIE